MNGFNESSTCIKGFGSLGMPLSRSINVILNYMYVKIKYF